MLLKEIMDLMEASKYDAMFDKILGGKLQFAGDDTLRLMKENIEGEIQWARSFLKREDRITWYLRLVKIHYMNILFSRYPDDNNIDSTFQNESDNETIKKEKQIINRDLQKTANKANINVNSVNSLRRIKEELTHYLGQDIASIRDYTFSNEPPRVMFDKLEDLENEWQAKIGTEAVKIQEDDKIILKFDGNMAWWLLPRSGCQDEANAMRHCGNVPTQKHGQRILSFRTHIDGDYWKPHLTFILDENRYLGEMKGRSNDKPAEKYHPYITALLKKQKLIKGIKGGGYEPQNNFSLDDLDENERDELVQMNPNLMSIFDKYRKDGPTNEVISGLEEKMDESDLPGIDMIKKKKVFLESWDNLERFVDDLDITPLKLLIEKIENEEDLMNNNLDSSEIQDFADELNVTPDLYYDILEKMTDETLKNIAKDLELSVDVSGFNGKQEIADNIDKSRYGDIIRRAIIKIQDFSGESIKEDPQLNEFLELIFDYIILRSGRNYHGYLEYDEKNIFESELKYSMDLDTFVNVLEESFVSGDDYDNEEAFMIAQDVIYSQSWMAIDSYEISESLKQLSKDEKYSDFSDEQKTLYKEFMTKVDNTDFNLDTVDPMDVARETVKMIQFNEITDLERLHILAGIKK